MALAPLATAADLDARSPTSPPGPPGRVDVMLGDVSAAVRAYSTQDFTRAVTTDWFRVRDPLRLPQRPVNEVTDVVDLAGDPVVGWTWDGLDRLYIDPFVATVGITYDHGYDEIPAEVVAIVCSVAARALATAPGSAAVTQESITNYAVSFGAVSAAGPVGLFANEAALLDRYRRVGGVVWMA